MPRARGQRSPPPPASSSSTPPRRETHRVRTIQKMAPTTNPAPQHFFPPPPDSEETHSGICPLKRRAHSAGFPRGLPPPRRGWLTRPLWSQPSSRRCTVPLANGAQRRDWSDTRCAGFQETGRRGGHVPARERCKHSPHPLNPEGGGGGNASSERAAIAAS